MIIAVPVGSILMQTAAYIIIAIFSILWVTQEPVVIPAQIPEESSLPGIEVVFKYERDLLDEIYNEGPEHEGDLLIAWREKSDDIDALIMEGWQDVHEMDKLHVLSHQQAVMDKNKLLQIGQAYRRILETMEERQKLWTSEEWTLIEWRNSVFRARHEAVQQIKHHEGEL